MDLIPTGAAADPEAPPCRIQLPELDEYASSSQGPRNQDNAPIYNWSTLDLLPSKNIGNWDQYEHKCEPLNEAALKGNWEIARVLIEEDPAMVRTAITEEYETALHVATKAQQTGFVLKILEHMNEQDLALQDLKGDTAFCFAVATRNIQLAEVMRNRNPDLATLRGSWNMTPLYLAVLLGKEDMAWFLYDTTFDLTAEERARIFFQSIKTDLYAEEHSMAFLVVRYLWMLTIKQNGDVRGQIKGASNLLFDAARMGNFPLLAELIRQYPDIVFELDENKRTIFHIAILHRHSSIFDLIHGLGNVRELIVTYMDAEKNTLLHLAAKNPNQSPALEMKQEWRLFKEVEKIIPVSLREAKNAEDLTTRELFFMEHSNIVKSGSEWLRNSASSFMLLPRSLLLWSLQQRIQFRVVTMIKLECLFFIRTFGFVSLLYQMQSQCPLRHFLF